MYRIILLQSIELYLVIFWVILKDYYIDEIEIEIEENCLKIIVMQHPIAKELRIINTIFKIITDFERIGNHITNICERIIYMVNGDRVNY